MKKILLTIILLLFTLGLYSQKNDCFSEEVNVNYIYYFINSNETNISKYGETSNDFNYGISFMISKYFNNFKLGIGMNYATKYFHSNNVTFAPTIDKSENRLQYLNFPIVASYKFFNKNKYSISINAGFVFHNILDYQVRTFYKDGSFNYYNWNVKNRNYKNIGISATFGPTFSREFGKNFKLNIYPNINYILLLDHSTDYYFSEFYPVHTHTEMPDDRLSLSLSVGIEYIFK